MLVRVDNLLVMQNDLRNAEQIRGMIDHIRQGGLWTHDALKQYANDHHIRTAPIIYLSRFPDNVIGIHDGHHRLVATHLGGRNELYPEEYEIHDWKYEDYNRIDFKLGYITPFDPLTEVRIPNLSAFKKMVWTIAEHDEKVAEQTIEENRLVFSLPRQIRLLPELAQRYDRQIALDELAALGQELDMGY